LSTPANENPPFTSESLILKQIDEHIIDLIAPRGSITLKRMFGVTGIFLNRKMFGLIYGGVLYLKADHRNSHNFRVERMEQFEYMRKGNRVGLSYYRAPEYILEDPGEALVWAKLSLEAAWRSNTPSSRSNNRADHHE